MSEQPYHRRVVDTELDELMPSLSALAIEGAKGVGKTATAMQRAASVRALDDPAQRRLADADPARLLDGPAPVHSIVNMDLYPLAERRQGAQLQLQS